MTRSKLSRSAIGAALGTAITVALSTAAFAPAFAAPIAPTITWSSQIADGDSFVFGEVPAAPTCEATTAETDVTVTCEVQGYAVTVGEHTLTAVATATSTVDPTSVTTVTDTTTITYSVLPWTLKGFYRPVKMGEGVSNTVKAGSTVPLKFKIYAGASKVRTRAAVQSVVAQQVGCTDLAAIGSPMPVTSTSKGFSLRFRDGAFHQNWKTPKLPKAPKPAKGAKKVALTACYTLTMTAQDGSALSALFRLK